MRIAIVDDEPLARARLRGQVADLGAGEIVAEAADGVTAIAMVDACRPDVVLLDIRMPGMDGIETARHLSGLATPPAVIFTTAYDEHALAAFEAHAVDYLLKPIRSERLREALARARMLTRAQGTGVSLAAGRQTRTHLSGLVHGTLRVAQVREIRFFQADAGYVRIAWPQGSFFAEESLHALEDEFHDTFLRVHRNALVAVEHVEALDRDRQGNTLIVLNGMTERLSVSRRLLGQVKQRLRG